MLSSASAPTNDLDQTELPQDLTKKYEKVRQDFQKKYKKSYAWLEENFSSTQELSEFTQKLLAAITLASQLAISQPVEAQVQKNIDAIERRQEKELISAISQQELEEILQKMVGFVNMEVGHLPKEDELYLEQQLTDMLGFEVTFELEENRLNHSIGIMGGEQHLLRHPGDTLAEHDAYREAGMAPKRGAYGWFLEDGELTEKMIQKEKYYFAVQTMYLPDWNTRHSELKPWYKFRKMIVINPAERLAVVGVVGDAGPAMWVQKQFGGSPEVIREGKIWSPSTKGRVIMMFVDDPDNEIPLGPIDLEDLKNMEGKI
jgi:hypothetical protein